MQFFVFRFTQMGKLQSQHQYYSVVHIEEFSYQYRFVFRSVFMGEFQFQYYFAFRFTSMRKSHYSTNALIGGVLNTFSSPHC